MKESLEYRGYRFEVFRKGPRWSVFIYAPGAIVAEPTIPLSEDTSDAGRYSVIQQAQAVVAKKLEKSK